MEPSITSDRYSNIDPQEPKPGSARVNPAKRVLYAIFFPGPKLLQDEFVLWTKICGWVKGGTLTKGGRLCLTSYGGIDWKSARYEVPGDEWHTTVSELVSVDLIPGNVARKIQAPFAAGIRETCALNSKDGVTRILVPSEAGRILRRVLDSTSDADIARIVTSAIADEAS